MSNPQTPSPNVSVPHEKGVHAVQTITIARPITEVYGFWNDLQRLPEVFEHLESIQLIAPGRAHYKLKLPANISTDFEAEIYTNVPNEVISWRSLAGSEFQNAGSIRFQEAPANQGTEVQITVEFVPPGGVLGKALTELFGKAPAQYLDQLLREYKQVMETGEKASTKGQSSGRNNPESDEGK